MIVTHKAFGEGIVVKCQNGHIDVEFSDDIKQFQFPASFEKGFLLSEYESFTNDIVNRINIDNEIEEINAFLTRIKLF